jgi:hypothetical protein
LLKPGLERRPIVCCSYSSLLTYGNITLYFDTTDKRVLDGQEARQFRDEFEREWREKLKKALRPDKSGQAA